MPNLLTPDQRSSLKKSFFNILAFFLEQENIESRYLRCLLKWGLQLNLSKEDLVLSNMDVSQLSFTEPREKMESLYHLVYLIYLDNLVEDVELEVATLYARRLSFEAHLINNLIAAITDRNLTHNTPAHLQAEIDKFMKFHNH
jgi:hypothetical protein